MTAMVGMVRKCCCGLELADLGPRNWMFNIADTIHLCWASYSEPHHTLTPCFPKICLSIILPFSSQPSSLLLSRFSWQIVYMYFLFLMIFFNHSPILSLITLSAGCLLYVCRCRAYTIMLTGMLAFLLNMSKISTVTLIWETYHDFSNCRRRELLFGYGLGKGITKLSLKEQGDLYCWLRVKLFPVTFKLAFENKNVA